MNKRIFKHQTSPIGEIPFYKIGTFGKQADSYISHELFEEYKKNYPFPKKGDLLIAASGSIGKIVEYHGEKAYFQDSNIVWLDHNEKVLNSYLKAYYQIINWSGIEGTTIKRLYNKNILKTKICFPSIKEQKQLGILIKKLEFLITLLQKKSSLQAQLQQGMYQKFFSLKQNYLKFKNEENTSKIVPLKEAITHEIKGKAKKEMFGTNSIYLDTAYLNGGNPFFVSTSSDVKRSDILILWDGSKAGTIYHGVEGALGSTLKAYTPKYFSSYLYHYLKSNQAKIYFSFRTPNIPHVIKDFTNRFMVKLPSNKEQELTGKLLDKFDNYKLETNKSITIFKQLKQFLLQNMFI
ncbi:restriction endonuclease subunit S [Lactobacillus sp. PV034]|nr:restriction endonuclease subunit S [Lactobacillus sp. PV034]